MLRRLVGVAVIVCSLLLSGCATVSNMQLTHRDKINEKFANLGSVQIASFYDYRPQKEMREFQGKNKYTTYPVILSGYSKPPVTKYLRGVLINEAQRTGIFNTKSETPEYTMTGIIYSMATGDTDKVADSNDKAQSRVYNFARVKILAVLRRNGKIVFRKTVSLNDTKPTLKNFDVKTQARMLDSLTTKAVRELYSDMEYRLKH